MMRSHSVFFIHFTQRTSQGVWHTEDTYEHKSWSEPKPFKSVYVASSKEVALAHWHYWVQHRGTKDNPLVLGEVEEFRQPTLLLELS